MGLLVLLNSLFSSLLHSHHDGGSRGWAWERDAGDHRAGAGRPLRFIGYRAFSVMEGIEPLTRS